MNAAAVQPLSRVRLSATLWTAAHQASLSFTVSQSLLNMSSSEPSNAYLLVNICEHCYWVLPSYIKWVSSLLKDTSKYFPKVMVATYTSTRGS